MKKRNWQTMGGICVLCTCLVLLVTSDFLKALESLSSGHIVTQNEQAYESGAQSLFPGNSSRPLSDISRLSSKTDNLYFNLPLRKERHLYQYEFITKSICKSKTSLVIFVFSSPQKFRNRMAIRHTWGSRNVLRGSKAKLLFIMGMPEPEFEWVDAEFIQGEQKIYMDIVRSQFVDTYKNLTMKSISMIQWVLDYCDEAKYLVKVDEDVILNVPRLQEVVQQESCSECLIGQVISGAPPVRDRRTKWYTSPGMYSGSVYPDYLSGTGYVIPTSFLPKLHHVILQTKRFWLEDIYITGICASKAGGKLVDNSYFNGVMIQKTPVCDQRLVTSHGFTYRQMLSCWKFIERNMLKFQKD